MKPKKITIIDYKLGNLFSVKHACGYVNLTTSISSDKKDIIDADALILPGVGAFGDAMKNLQELDMIEPILDFVASGKPLLGICLGMQLLFTESYEFGEHKGLNIIEGEITKFPSMGMNGKSIRVPHISWNRINLPTNQSWENSPLQGLEDGAYMYFVHSYFANPQNNADMLTQTEYEGINFCSSVKKGNVFASQFHPEKSGQKGIGIYRTWANMINN
jgi:glutamine amidotransferase